MKSKILRGLIITSGVLLLGDGVLMSLIANFNLGLLPVYILGVLLTGYGVLFPQLKGKRLIHIFMATLLSVIIGFSSFLCAYGKNDNVSYREQAIIVLGCGIRGERVSVGLAKRLDKAYAYHLENPSAFIIVSGGQGPQEDIPEALAMKRYLMERGVAEEKIIMEDKSTSTITNLAYSHEIMKERGISESSVAVVSNAYHIYRAVSYAKKQGLEATHLGTDIIWYTVPMNYMREILAVMKMWVFD